MKIHKNPDCKKIKGSHILEITCAHCKGFIAHYQKAGTGGLLRMYHERIIEGSVDFSQYPSAIFCPSCGEQIATRYTVKPSKIEAYRFVPSAFNKRKVRWLDKK